MSAEGLEQKLLETLDKGDIEDTGVWAQKQGIPHDAVLDGALKRLNSFEMVVLELVEKKVLALTPDAESVVAHGSPEVVVFNAVPVGDKINKNDLDAKVGPNAAKLGYGQATKLGWIKSESIEDKDAPKKDPKDKTPKIVLVFRNVDKVEDQNRDLVLKVKNNAPVTDKEIDALKQRRMVQLNSVKTYKVTKGLKFKATITAVSDNLTAAMLANGSWKDATFKEFNLKDAKGKDPQGGHLHPLMKVRTEIREIFIGMGFEEMPTNNYVESSFWNFDSLFQPQQHPARDAHDTFFLKDPATSDKFPPDYLERVKEVHQTGGYGSIGYRYDWKVEEAQKSMLYKLAQNGFKPAKYFSIDRVFRNETLDATHLAEFHQIEGLVADYSLADLLGVISQFFQRLGIENIRFKPAYNPYTEPSMEIFGFHPLVKGGSWVELGNSDESMFRPEMLRPMGLPENVRVIAWGLSLERPTMIKYGIASIRDIFGSEIDLNFIKDNPLAFIDGKTN